MSGRIAILTPDPADFYFESRWTDVFKRNAAPLFADGVFVEDRVWTGAADLRDFDLVLPLLAWGYPRAHVRWVNTVRAWEAQGVRLQNPASVLVWNSDKLYLGRLAERGVPVVPTLYADTADAAFLEEAAARFGAERLVAKPQVSSGAWQTVRWARGEPLPEGPEGGAMVQPYLPSIEEEGEVSLLFFGGRFSHAVRKRPQPGDFRVQPEHDGIISACRPEPDEIAAAMRILEAVEEDLLYARVDLVRGLSGGPELIELELIEPDLYLGYDANEGALFAEAVKELIAR
jgi:glutathione synthase/RimK-type ligase-like ATP-grasp enzyme